MVASSEDLKNLIGMRGFDFTHNGQAALLATHALSLRLPITS